MHEKTPARFELEAFHRDISDDDLIADLVRVSDELGKKTITFREYNKTGKFSSSTIATRFGSWLRAQELGRQPKFRDLSAEISAHSANTYAYRFGGWREALREFVDWANDQNVPMEPRDQLDLKTRKTPRNVNWRLRAQVLMRDSAKCHLCGATPADGAKLHVDHIHPWSKGGETTINNLQILCEICNIGKGDFVA